MQYISTFIIRYWVLLCISIVMIINSIIRIKEHKKISIYILEITGLILLLSILDILKACCQDNMSKFPTTLITAITYSLNPLCILLFIHLSEQSKKTKPNKLLYVPIVVNIIIYLFALFPATKELVFYFYVAPNGTLAWHEGTTILRFTSHFISAIYLGYLIVRSITSLKARHIWHATNILICAAMTITAALIETFDENGEIKVLNSTIAVCVTIYYLYLYTEKTKFDQLTGVFNRNMYYIDLKNMDKSITGVIQADINNLKYINDHLGHLEGDLAIKTIADALIKHCTKKMYIYRFGGDEFTILCVNERKAEMLAFIDKVKTTLSSIEYSCSLGYCHRKNNNDMTVKELFAEADAKMYSDKNKFYQNSNIERRK